jgi:hypothetical protein
MDEDLKQFLTRIAERQDARMDKLDARMDRLETAMEAMGARLDAKIEKVETTLLTEFHKWASPLESRERATREIARALDLELDLLKERVRKLEGQLPF